MGDDAQKVVICPNCNRKVVFSYARAGGNVYCPHCDRPIILGRRASPLDPPGLRLWTIPLAVLGGTALGGLIAGVLPTLKVIGVLHRVALGVVGTFVFWLAIGLLSTILAAEALAALPVFQHWRDHSRATRRGCLAMAILVFGVPLSLVLGTIAWQFCFFTPPHPGMHQPRPDLVEFVLGYYFSSAIIAAVCGWVAGLVVRLRR